MGHSHIWHLQLAPFDHGLVVGPYVGHIGGYEAKHLPVGGALLVREQLVDVPHQSALDSCIPRLSNSGIEINWFE